MKLAELPEPIVQAPLAGGPSTPRLAAAVASAGGFGFLAAGYKAAEAVADDIAELRSLSDAPFGVNVFAPPGPAAPDGLLDRWMARMRSSSEASRYGVQPGEPRHDDDRYEAKLALLSGERPAVVSFTFGCPSREVVDRMHSAGSDVWVTVTDVEEAALAVGVGADALVVQGYEAGGHRGYFDDAGDRDDLGLLVALRLIAARVDLPLIAAGGIADGSAVAAVLCAGAAAAQIGSALMLTPEAATSAPHRAELEKPGPTRLTRAFSGRQARGIVNGFMIEHSPEAPRAYPDVHHVTSPIRAAAREAGDADAINLWAGQAHELARAEPAAEVVRRLGAEARVALRAAADRLNVEA